MTDMTVILDDPQEIINNLKKAIAKFDKDVDLSDLPHLEDLKSRYKNSLRGKIFPQKKYLGSDEATWYSLTYLYFDSTYGMIKYYDPDRNYYNATAKRKRAKRLLKDIESSFKIGKTINISSRDALTLEKIFDDSYGVGYYQF